MIEYSDDYLLEIWTRLYPVSHPWHRTHGGRQISVIVSKEKLKQLVDDWLHNPEVD